MATCTFNRSCLISHCWYSTGSHSHEWLTSLLWCWHWLWCRWARGRIPEERRPEQPTIPNPTPRFTKEKSPVTTTTIKAWAIDSGADESHSVFLGVFWFCPGMDLKAFQDGMRIAAFRTRRQAQEAMEYAEVKRTYPKARVVRVTIAVSG